MAAARSDPELAAHRPAYDSEGYAASNRWDPTHLEKVDRLLGPSPGDWVLDVGCGQGHLVHRLAARGIEAVGIDANSHAPVVSESDLIHHMRAEILEFDDGTFDAIVSVHTIEHIPDVNAALAEMARVLKPGGSAMLIYPAEPIMGVYAIPASVILHGTPFKARQVHCHKLWPRKLRRMVEPLGMAETHHEFNLLRFPQFVSVLRKG